MAIFVVIRKIERGYSKKGIVVLKLCQIQSWCSKNKTLFMVIKTAYRNKFNILFEQPLICYFIQK